MYLHPLSAEILTKTAAQLPQSLLLSGPSGIGTKGAVAVLAQQLSVVPQYVLPEKNEAVDEEKGTITVASIRRIYDQTRSKQQRAQLIVIDYAERMTVQAQNAFLKLLEEPADATHFILLAHDTTVLLPTVLSRVQQLVLQPITDVQSRELMQALGVTDSTKRTQLLYMAAGLPAELTRLIQDESYFEVRAMSLRHARQLLQASPYEALTLLPSYKDNRQAALRLIEDTITLLRRSLSDKPQPAMLRRLEIAARAHERLQANGSVRLALLAFVV